MRMPQKISEALSQCQTAPPKPDLAVAFKTKSIIDKTELIDLGFFKGHMRAELAKEANDGRAFHSSRWKLKGLKEITQTGLHIVRTLTLLLRVFITCMSFMKKADKEDDFFAKVRFFSVIATTQGPGPQSGKANK